MFRTARATTVSNREGSVLARKPRRIIRNAHTAPITVNYAEDTLTFAEGLARDSSHSTLVQTIRGLGILLGSDVTGYRWRYANSRNRG